MKKILLKTVAMLLFTMQIAMAQNVSVSGTVTSRDDGQPIPGVSVVVKGTTIGTQTDVSGRYSLSVPQGSTLVFSFITFAVREVVVGNQTTINMVLVPEQRQLSEVVVTALGIEKNKKDLGYGVTTISSEELIQGRTTNVVNALAGKVAGVRISSSNGMTGSGSSVFIRGFTTITGSNQPLFVVDGIPIDNGGGAMALQNGTSNSNRAIDINQEDIENVTVLKGPAAAALYGSRAANGAIIITTKKGKRGEKSKIEFSNSTNIIQVNRFPDWQNEYSQGVNGAFNANANLSWGPKITGQTVTNFLGQQESLQAFPDNIRGLFKNGSNIQNNLVFNSSSDNATYQFSYGNTRETGVLENNELSRNNFRINTSNKLSSKLLTTASVQYVNLTGQKTQTGNQLSNPFFRGWFIPPNIDLQGLPFEDAAGNQIYFDGTDNPIWTIKNNLFDEEINRIIGNVALNYDALPWLNINYKIGGDFFSQVRKGFDQIGARGGANVTAGGAGGIIESNADSRDLYSYLNVTAKRNITDDLSFTLTVGNEIADRRFVFEQIIGRQLVVRSFRNISNAVSFSPSNGSSRQTLIGVYGDLILNYKGYLSLNLTGRNDFSSTLPQQSRSFFYPSVATSFVLTEAVPSIKGKGLSYAKLIANYARVGKDAPLYATDTYFGLAGSADGFGPTISFPFNGLPGFSLGNQAGNPGIEPEFTASFEVGGEFSFLNDRLGLDVNLYKSNSTNIIFNVPVAPSSGSTSQVRNAGELETKGLELLLKGTPFKTKNFAWNTAINFTKSRTIVKKLADGVPNIVLAGFVTPNIRLEPGKPYGILFGTVFQRDANGNQVLNAQGLPILDPITRQIGDTNPDWLMGITNDISYKGFNLSFLIDIRKGGDVFSRNIGDLRRSGRAIETAEFERFDAMGNPTRPYVIPGVNQMGQPNTVAITAEEYWGRLFAFGTGESYVFDGSWVRLREASLSYTVPKQFLDKTPFGRLDIGVNGRNLFSYFPNFPHFDPETNALGVSNGQGFEFNGLPQTRNYGFFIRATF